MPIYCYECVSCGEKPEELFNYSDDVPEHISCIECGANAIRDIQAEHGLHRQYVTWSTPLMSDALGVCPTQVKEAEKRMAEAGCPTSYDRKTGEAKLVNRTHRNKVMELSGHKDLSAGYGDYAGENTGKRR